MDRRILVPLLAAAGVVFACGPLPHFGSGLPVRSARLRHPTHTSTAAHGLKRAPGAPDVEGALAVAPTAVAGNAEVHFALTVVNASDRRVEVDFPDGRTRDFAVYDSAGRELWRASRGRLYTQLVQNTLLAAGDTVVYEAAWRAPAPGRYAVVAELRSTNHPVLRHSDFVVPPTVVARASDTPPAPAAGHAASGVTVASAQ